MRILVIEDDAALHRIISKRLKEAGHSWMTALTVKRV
jgi:DNA-binding response OmpR family regulator